MGTLRHQKQSAGKPVGRKSTAKKPKTPGKFGKFARRLGLVAGIAIIAPSLSSAQDHIKKQVNTPADSPAQITMASAGERAPANTYVVPKTDGEGVKKTETVSPEQKWCDGIEIINDSLVFKRVNVNEKLGDAYVNMKEFLYVYALDGVTTENIKWQETRIINGKKLAVLVIENEDNSVLVTSNPDFGTGNDTWGKGLFDKDTRIFAHDGAKYISNTGEVLAATPTTILIIPPGIKGIMTRITLSKLVGGDAPLMQNPQISEENGWYVIKDPIIKNSKGEQMKVIFKIFPGEDKFESGIISENATPR